MSAEQKDVTNEELGVETIYEFKNVSGEVYKRPGKLGEVQPGAYFSVVGGTKEYATVQASKGFELFRTRSSAVSARKEQRVSGFARVEPDQTSTTTA